MHQGIESASLRIQPETARSPNRQRAPSPWLDLRGDVTEESELESAIRRANCLVWHADVDEREEGQLQWKMTLKASPLLRKIFGSDSPAKGNILWTRDDVPRWDAISRRSRTAILGGKPGYNQQFQVYVRERAFYLDEHVSITRVSSQVEPCRRRGRHHCKAHGRTRADTPDGPSFDRSIQRQRSRYCS